MFKRKLKTSLSFIILVWPKTKFYKVKLTLSEKCFTSFFNIIFIHNSYLPPLNHQRNSYAFEKVSINNRTWEIQLNLCTLPESENSGHYWQVVVFQGSFEFFKVKSGRQKMVVIDGWSLVKVEVFFRKLK